MECCGGLDEHEDDCKEIKAKDSIDQGTVDAAKALESENYSAGFVTDVETEFAPKGLNEDIVRYISAKGRWSATTGRSWRCCEITLTNTRTTGTSSHPC